MATILSLALKVNADASGVVKNLTPAERALENLAKQASKATSAFDVLAKDSQAAADAQAALNQKFADLAEQLKGGLSAQQYADQFASLTAEVKNTADAYARGAEVTKKYASAEQQRQDAVAELQRLLLLGAISEETYGRAVYEGSEAQAKAIATERERLEVLGQGQRLAEQFATAEERRAQQLADVDRLLKAGAISEETAARARAEFSGQNAAAIQAEKDLAAAAEESAKRRTAAEKEASDFIDKVRGDIEKASALQIAEAEKIRAQAIAAAGRIIEANLTPQERYDRQMQELNTHLHEGRLSQDQFNRAAARAEQDLNGVAKEATVADDRIDNLNKNVSLLAKIEIGRLIVDGLQALGSVFTRVTSEVTSLVSSVNTSVDTLNDFSARTGIGVEALQGYSLAAKLAGVDTEQFFEAVQKLSVNIGKATPGDALDKSLKAINLSVVELRALSPEDQFSAIGNAISQLPTAADRAAAAVEIFGKQGAALAPLFREGAASLEELQAKAERLGIIVSETQVNNVADMNDAFDLVRATIEGIVGQVIGNLAPAVTAVANDLLKFVETYQGIDGTVGGTAFANSITDAFIEGAQLFISVMAKFADVAKEIAAALGVDLRSDAEKRLSALEAQVAAGTAPQIALDPTGFVTELAPDFLAEIAKLREQVAEEATQSAVASAQGFLNDFANTIKQRRLPEIKIALNLGDTEERLQQFLATAGDEASVFLQQSMATVETFQEMAAAGGLTADQIEIMNGFMKNVNAELDKELAKRKDAADAATKQAEADQKRVDSLLGSSDAAQKIRDDLDAVAREQERVLQTLADPKTADAQLEEAAGRLEQLDNLQSSLEEKLQASSQGFSEGFDKAFESTTNGLTSLIVKAEEFGPAGAAAAEELRIGIERAQNQAAGGIITKEAYDLEVERQKQLFDDRLKQEEEVAKARLKQEEEVDKTLFAAAYGYNSERIKAAETYALLVDEMLVTEEAIAAARANGNQEELAALSQRLQALDQAAAREDDIASGQAKAREEEEKRVKKLQEDTQKQGEKARDEYLKQQEKIFEEQRKAAEAEAKRQEERIRKLNTLGAQSISVADVRSVEGANLVLQTAAQAQDPALIQARLQTKLLEQVALGIGQAASNYFNQPVAIVGAARLN
jgi:hypothetical protein